MEGVATRGEEVRSEARGEHSSKFGVFRPRIIGIFEFVVRFTG